MSKHKDYTVQPEQFEGIIPLNKIIEISDLYAEGKSPMDVVGLVRIDGKKIQPNVIKTVYTHIKEIENVAVNILNGTSSLYTPIIEDDVELWSAPPIPTSPEELVEAIMFLLQMEDYVYIYDGTYEDLTPPISNIINNICAAQVANGSGTFEDLVLAVGV